MGGTDRRRTRGAVALIAIVLVLGVGAAVLTPSSSSLRRLPYTSAIEISVPPLLWAVMFLGPLLVGAAVYLLPRAFRTTTVRFAGGRGTATTTAGGDRTAIDVERWLQQQRARERSASSRLRGAVALAVVLTIVVVMFAVVVQATLHGTSVLGFMGAAPGGGYGSGGGGGGSGGGHGPGGGDGTGGNGSGNGTGGGVGSGNNTTGSGGGTGGTGGSGGTGNGSGGNGGSGGSGGTGGSGGGTGGGGGSGGSGSGGTGGNGSGNNSSGVRGAARPARGWSVAVPDWAFLVAAVVLSVLVGVLAVPGILASLNAPRAANGRALPRGLDPVRVGTAFRDARKAIEAGDSPRETIVQLYNRLLTAIAGNSRELATSTAEEIRETRLVALQVAPNRAQAITEMFEEACYSTHPIERAGVDRFVATMRGVEHDLLSAGASR